MECTALVHTDGKKEIRYTHDIVEIAHGIATYHYIDLPETTIEEIEQTATDRVQSLLSKLF